MVKRKGFVAELKSDLVADEAVAKERQHERDIAKLKGKLAVGSQKLKLAEADLSLAYERADFLDDLGRPTPAQFTIRAAKVHGSATAIVLLSDWHVEETVDPSTVNYKNEFNLTIASKRIKNTFERVVELIDKERRQSNIRDLVLAALGDFISGYIHPELVESNSLSPTEASLFVQDQLVGGIEFLKKHGGFKSITIPALSGNHGRTTDKPRYSTEFKNSYEWLLYKQLERYYRNDPKVQWRVENGYITWLDIQGHKCRFHHGHRVKYRGGVGGPTVAINNTIYRMNRTEAADLDLFGHLHTHLLDVHFVCNNALIGYTSFGVTRGFLPPSQTLVVLDKKRKPATLVQEIFCD